MVVKGFLFAGLGIVLVVYLITLVRGGVVRPTWFQQLVGFVTAFFDTLGIGSFPATTAIYKFKKKVPGKVVPRPRNVRHTPPTQTPAFLHTKNRAAGTPTRVPVG